MSGELDFSMVCNNDCAIDLYVRRRGSKLPLNLTGCRVIWQLFVNGVARITKDTDNGDEEIMIFDQSQSQNLGRLRLFLVPGDTKEIPGDNFYTHEYVVMDATGKVLNVTEDDKLLSAGKAYLRRQHTVQAEA